MGYAESILEKNPVRYYRLGELVGTTAVDQTGNQDGTYGNSPTLGVSALVTDPDKAVDFNGVNGPTAEFVSIGTSPISGTSDFTIAAWVKTSGPTIPFNEQIIFSSVDLDGGGFENEGIELKLLGGYATLDVWESGTSIYNSDLPLIEDGLAHQIVGVRRNVGGGLSDIEVWVDGVLVSSNILYSIPAPPVTSITANSSWIAKGPDQTNPADDTPGFTPQSPFHGIIDEVAIWNRALSLDEIVSIYAGTQIMSYQVESDVVLAVFRTSDQLPLVGFDSPFTAKPHPGTHKKVTGWQWDKKVWPSELELQSQESAPSIFDPDNSALNQPDFQSGIGDNTDLEVNEIARLATKETEVWAPVVEHGYYYDGEEESILFSDDSCLERLTRTGFMDPLNFCDLTFTPKPGFAITLNKYKWNPDTATYDYFLRLKKKQSFTGAKQIDGSRLPTRDSSGNIILANIDASTQEFVVDPSSAADPIFKVVSNADYFVHHGTDPAISRSGMEVLGVSSGSNSEEFHFAYSPMLDSGTYLTTTDVVSFLTSGGSYTTWSPVEEFSGVGHECIIDYDLGVVRFDESPANHPAANETIAARYWSAPAVEYEPLGSRDTILAKEVDVDPLGKTSDAGFIYLKRELIEPFSITLDAEAPVIALPDLYGPAFLGTATRIRGKVSSKSGEAIEGALVTFSLTNSVGAFSGGLSSVSSLSTFQGIAKTLFNAPRNIKTLGSISNNVVINAGKTEITINTVNLVGDPTAWYVYKVFDDDPILGLGNLDQHYLDFFSQEGITGPTTSLNLDGLGSGWEQTHRILTGLLTPVQYNAAIRNGRKQLAIIWDPTAIDPHNANPYNPGTTGAFVPLRPESSTLLGAQTKVVINAVLPIPRSGGNETLAGYFIVGPTVATIQASVYNERLRTTIVSNVLELQVQVPSSMDGTVLISNLNAAQKTELFGGVVPTSGILPLGFRLKTNTLNLAAVLDGLTYLDINRPTEVLGHAFTVKSP